MSSLTSNQQAGVKDSRPWVEKYRPKQLSDLISHEDIISTIGKLMETERLPHLLFYGPPGTGKTSTILACCRELYGYEIMKTRVLELNASDDRGIKVVRTKIKAVFTNLCFILCFKVPHN